MLRLEKFKNEQLKLAGEVILRDSFSKINYLAGCDQAFLEDDVISAVVVLDKSLKVIETKYARLKPEIPYVPGYLFYREGPAIIDAFNKLETKPDILMVGGNGILHPRRIGIASHLGIVLNIPTIGVAKKLMCGDVEKGKVYMDKEVRGIELKTKEHSNPIYISPGHNITLGRSIEIVKDTLKFPHKMPEPLHFAHKAANAFRDLALT